MATQLGLNHKCAAAIRNFWAKLGYYPNVRVETKKFMLPHVPKATKEASEKEMTVHFVQSDLVNGVPQGVTRDTIKKLAKMPAATSKYAYA